MTPEQKNEQYLEEQIKVAEYEGKIPKQPYVWNCPSCFNVNEDSYYADDKRIYCRMKAMNVARSIRPKDLREEGEAPEWCPCQEECRN